MASLLRGLVLLGVATLGSGDLFAGNPPESVPDGAVSVAEESPLSEAQFLGSHQPEGARLDGAEVSLSDEEFLILLLGAFACALLIVLIV